MADWSVYLVRCADGSLYTGITTDVELRFSQHQEGTGAKYLRGKGPLKLVFSQAVGDRSVASQYEYRVKRLKKGEKEKLVSGRMKLESL